ncbi:MAG: glycosyltransferase family 1 protein [Bacteroides thetaiotaomicron]|nr:glycosyltransferase family 1 protein [Bacteroides thetaiotaomicron]
MKILMVNTVEFTRNGITTCISNYSKELRKVNVEVHILAIPPMDEGLLSELESAGIHIIRFEQRNKNLLSYLSGLVKVIKEEDYDLVHVHGNSCTMSIECFAAMLAGCKVRIAHCHNTKCDHYLVHRLLRPLFELTCTHRFACSQEAGSWIFKRKNFEVINNGIYVDKYAYNEDIRMKMRKQIGVKPDEILLGYVGLFNYQKNQEFLIELISGLDSSYKLLLVGNGENYDGIKQKVQEKHLEKRVIFTGSVNNVCDYYQAMDCFLFPSRFEGFGLVALEAQAAGLPCINSEFVPQVIDVTHTAVFLPLDTSVWLDKIRTSEVVRNSDVGNKLKDAGFDITVNAGTLYKLYESYCG